MRISGLHVNAIKLQRLVRGEGRETPIEVEHGLAAWSSTISYYGAHRGEHVYTMSQ
jgi:hypothetical protein